MTSTSPLEELFASRDVAGGASESTIAGAEAALGVRFPPSYRSFLAQFGAAVGRGVSIADLFHHADPSEPPLWENVVTNTGVMADTRPDQRGVVSGMLNLSRNLGLITGASAMGAVFAFASAASDITAAPSESVATGMRITFGVAASLIVVALAIAAGSRTLATRPSLPEDAS